MVSDDVCWHLACWCTKAPLMTLIEQSSPWRSNSKPVLCAANLFSHILQLGPRHLNLGSFLVLEPLADSLRGYAAVGSVTVCNLEAEGWELSRWGEVTDALRPGSFFWTRLPLHHMSCKVCETLRDRHIWADRSKWGRELINNKRIRKKSKTIK